MIDEHEAGTFATHTPGMRFVAPAQPKLVDIQYHALQYV